MKPDFPTILLIAGNGQNSGKTTLVCSIISHFAEKQPLIAVKVSPHFHKLTEQDHILEKTDNYILVEEFNTDRSKDSSLMLQAGAQRVFFLLAGDDDLPGAFSRIMEFAGDNQPVICESGGLINVLNPGLFLFVHNVQKEIPANGKNKRTRLPDRIIRNDSTSFSFNINDLVFQQNHGWKISE